jgi:serine/threonine protein kinase/Flp pilus assembly protein TadD
LRAEVEALLRANECSGDLLDLPDKPAATIDEPITERPGTVIGPYKLLEQIGEGGFGIVFMAEQTQPLRRKVALKVLKPGMDTRQVIARFEAERQALALMDHPNIAKVLDAGTASSGRPYFVMDLVKGLPITDYCDQNQLTPRERLGLFVHVCLAVQHAHQKGIIHRDLKPSNVLVTLHDGSPMAKVIDFGIAKALGQQLTDKTLFTGFAQMIGTPLYMSPEQAALSNVDVDTRSDIYSLGVLLYELLTGTTPFDKERFKEVGYDELRRIIREEEPVKPSTRISTMGQAASTVTGQRKSDPRKLSQLLRGELDWIVMKALEKDRNRRYETASAFAADVQHYLNDEPVLACPPSAWYRFRKFARRKKTALAMAACVFVALAGIAGSIGWAVRDRAARDHDQAAREEALNKEVERLLDEAGPLIEQGKWPEALAHVDRADKLLTAAGRTERPPRLLELHKDLSMAERLEQIYQEPKRELKAHVLLADGQGIEHTSQGQADSAEEEFFSGRQQDARFAKAFQEFGIDLEALEPAEAAVRIRGTSVPQALVRALDQWAAMRKRARGDDDAFWKKLVQVAQQADLDEWRNQFREALLRRDRPVLEKLADAVPIRDVPPATVYLLGLALKDLAALDKAMAVLREAQRHRPDDYWLNDALGWLSKDFCRPPRYDDALRYYSITVALRPKSTHTHRAVADVLRKKGAWQEADAEDSKALDLDTRYTPGASRGTKYLQLHQYDKAVADLSRAIELNPKWQLPLFNRGSAYMSLHQYDKALADYTKAIELNPKDPGHRAARGSAYTKLHEYDKAVADLKKAIELDPNDAWVWNHVAYAYEEMHQYDKFIKFIADYSKAIELDPKNAEACNIMAWRLATCPDATLRDAARAVTLAKRAVELAPKELAPKHGLYWNTLGVAHYRAGHWKNAIQCLTKSMELQNGQMESLNTFFLAMAHWQLGEKEKARQWYNQAVQWMQKNKLQNEGLRWLRAEAEDVLGVNSKM